jgi:hypothetical protein
MSGEPTDAGAGARERVLVATIGNRDPLGDGEPTGPLRAAAAVRPARAYLVHSERTADRDYAAAAAETARLVQQEVPGCLAETRSHGVANPTDLPALVAAMARLLGGLGADDADVHVCASSGTPQMGLALTLAAEARYGAGRVTHWQGLDPRFAAEPLTRLEPGVLFHHFELRRALEALAACRVADAAAGLARAAEGPPGAARRAIERAAGAARQLEQVAELRRRPAVLRPNDLRREERAERPRLAAFVDWYAALAQDAGGGRWPAELAALAMREERAGRPVLALVRLALAQEVAVAARLEERHGIDADRPGPDGWKRIAEAVPEVDAAAPRFEGLKNRLDLLARLEPGVDGRIPTALELAHERNVIVHQGRGRAATDWGSYVENLRALYAGFGWPDPAETPGAPEAVAVLAAELARWVGVGLEPPS